MKSLFAEFTGTCLLVLVGTGAIVINDEFEGVVTHLGISIAFGGIVTAMIFAFIKVSGAHLNPGVTLGMVLRKQMPFSQFLPYVAAQCSGAIVASAFLALLFPNHPHLGATQISVHWPSGLLVETAMSFLLFLGILWVAFEARPKTWKIALVVGAIVGIEAFFGGPLTGASMNPARSLGPALLSGTWNHFWIYLVGPFAGMTLAAFACPYLRVSSSCCEEGC
ncbi:MAG: MIP/aquaporin family protein [Salibacteraceae bacterium]